MLICTSSITFNRVLLSNSESVRYSKSIEGCGGVEKIVQISASFDGQEKVLCLNAEQFLLRGISVE